MVATSVPMMSLHRPEAVLLDQQNRIGHDRGDAHANNERQMQQEGQTDRAAEKFGEIGRHRCNLAHDPHGDDNRFRKMRAAQFGEVAAGDDAKLG